MNYTIMRFMAMWVLMVVVCGAQQVYVRELPAHNALTPKLRALLRDFGPTKAGFALETAEALECAEAVMKFMERSFRADVPENELVFRAQCVVYFRDVGDNGKVSCSVGFGFDAYELGSKEAYFERCPDFPIVMEPTFDKMLIDAVVDWTAGLHLRSNNVLIHRDTTESSTVSVALSSPSVSQSIQGTVSGQCDGAWGEYKAFLTRCQGC